MLCRGLNFTLPQRTSSREIHATFEKVYWKLEPKRNDSGKKELAAKSKSAVTPALKLQLGDAPKSETALLNSQHQQFMRNKPFERHQNHLMLILVDEGPCTKEKKNFEYLKIFRNYLTGRGVHQRLLELFWDVVFSGKSTRSYFECNFPQLYV